MLISRRCLAIFRRKRLLLATREITDAATLVGAVV